MSKFDYPIWVHAVSQVCEIFLADSTWEELFSIKWIMTTGERIMKRTCGVGWCWEQSCPAHKGMFWGSACAKMGFHSLSSSVTLMRCRHEGRCILHGAVWHMVDAVTDSHWGQARRRPTDPWSLLNSLCHWKGMITYWEIVKGQSRISGETRENKNRKLFNHFM